MTTIQEWVEGLVDEMWLRTETPADAIVATVEILGRLGETDCEGSDEVIATILARRQSEKMPELDWSGIQLPDGRLAGIAKYQHEKSGLAYAVQLKNGERETVFSLTPEILVLLTMLFEKQVVADDDDLAPAMAWLNEQASAIKETPNP